MIFVGSPGSRRTEKKSPSSVVRAHYRNVDAECSWLMELAAVSPSNPLPERKRRDSLPCSIGAKKLSVEELLNRKYEVRGTKHKTFVLLTLYFVLSGLR